VADYIVGVNGTLQMSPKLNEAVVGDTAKLVIHRLIARRIRRDPTLLERAKVVHARQADQFEGWPFVKEWDVLLSLSPAELTAKLVSRDREMVRLRNSSPFYLAHDALKDPEFRGRIACAARRLAYQSGGLSGPSARMP
jgi:hypothetical protein